MQPQEPATWVPGRRPVSFLLAILLAATAGVAVADDESSLGLPSLKIELGDPSRVTFGEDELAIRDLRDITGRSSDRCVLTIGDDLQAETGTVETPLLNVSSDLELGFNKQKRWIGIRRQARGVDCGRVTEGQSLTLGLGSKLEELGLKALGATLTLNLKMDSSIEVLLIDGGETRGSIEIQSGKSVGSPHDADEVFICTEATDSGPDSEPPCEIPVEDFGLFDELRLTTTNDGEWSLAGTTEFELAGGQVDCGETIEAEADDAFAELTRLEEEDCEPIPFTLRWLIERDESASIEFLAEKDDQVGRFLWSVTWPPEQLGELRPEPKDEAVKADEEPTETFAGRIPLSTQQFLPDDEVFFIDTCLGQRIVEEDEEGNLVITGLFPPVDGFPDMSDAEGTQYGCWLTRSIEYLSTQESAVVEGIEEDVIRVRESGYLEGDWTATRTLR